MDVHNVNLEYVVHQRNYDELSELPPLCGALPARRYIKMAVGSDDMCLRNQHSEGQEHGSAKSCP
jgi:hypothetical protein